MTSLLRELESKVALSNVANHPAIRSWTPYVDAPAMFYLVEVGDRTVGWGVPTAIHQADVIAFLASITPELLDTVSEASPIAVREAAEQPFGRFSHLCVVHPSWAQFSLNAATQFMASRVHQVFPCFRCEFTDDESLEEFRFRKSGRGTGLNDPTRAPNPALAMRYEHLRPKRTGSSGGKKMGIFPWHDVHQHVLMLPEAGGFVELENFERHRVNITHDHKADLWRVSEKGRTWEPFADEIEPWLKALCFEGQASADATIVRPR